MRRGGGRVKACRRGREGGGEGEDEGEGKGEGEGEGGRVGGKVGATAEGWGRRGAGGGVRFLTPASVGMTT